MIKFAPVLISLLAFTSAGLPTIWRRPDHQRIIKGEDAVEGEFPFMASFSYGSSTALNHMCGATILTDRWALTAAHCCSGISSVRGYYLYVGSIFSYKGGSAHALERIVRHEKYNQADYWRNDICLLKVSQPFRFSERVKQVVLAGKPTVEAGDRVDVIGWGRTKPNSPELAKRLQKGLNFVAMSKGECENVTGIKMFQGYLCARGRISGQQTYFGDSGGPLTKNGVQVGLVSFGYDPGTDYPTVYTCVSFYIDWIKKKLEQDAESLILV